MNFLLEGFFQAFHLLLGGNAETYSAVWATVKVSSYSIGGSLLIGIPLGFCLGYFDFSGNMDTCIAIRTVVLTGETAYVQAGGGIVADSVPEREFEETLNKAKALLRAIQVAETLA